MARPTKYNDEMVAKAWEYLDNYLEHDDLIPSAVGLAVALNVDESTIYAWAKDEDKEFSKILGACKAKQQKVLLKGGLSGEMNSAIVKLVLGKHGYHDKQDNTHAGTDGGPVQIQEIARTIVDPKERSS